MSNAACTVDSPHDRPFDGDPTWRVRWVLRDGAVAIVRPVVPSDRAELRSEFLKLSPESHHARFLGLGVTPTDELMDYFTRVDQHDHVAIGVTIDSADLKTERGVGIARLIRLEKGSATAEMAITVADDMQQRGIGTILLRELIRAAKIQGITTIRAEVLCTNVSMRRILERAGATVSVEESGGEAVAYDLAIHDRASGVSVFDILRGAAQGVLVFLRRGGGHPGVARHGPRSLT